MGTGIHNAKVEGIKEGGELPRLCNFIAESAIRFLSKLSCRWRRSYRAAHQDSAGRIGRLAACAAAGDEVGKPAQAGRLRQALMFGFAEQEIDSSVQRVGDADECGVVGFAALGDVVVHPGSADAYAIREVRLRNVPFIQQLPQTVAEQDVNNVFRFQGDHPLALGRRPLRVSGVRDSDSQ